MRTRLFLSIFSNFVSSNIDEPSIEVLKGASMGVYIECTIDRMCAWMAETWLESVDIAEEDVPMLTFKDIDDPLCAATDLGALEGMPDDMHFWRWCSREETEEEHGAHEEEEEETTVGPDGEAAPKLSHYTCGTDTGIHQGETGDEITDAWLEEPHIRHNNTIKTNDPYHPRQITIPVECEWPTIGEGNDPLGFNFRRGGPSYFKTESSIDLSVEIQLFKTRSFTEAHGTKPQFTLTGQSEIFISVKFLEEVPSDVWMQLVHLWASPIASSSQDVFFAWIMGTCEQHSKVQFLESPSKQEARVSLPVFMFEDSDEVYFHAIVKACRASECSSGCSSSWAGFNGDRQELSRSGFRERMRRSAPTSSSLLSIGPIKLVEKENSQNGWNAVFLAFATVLLIYLSLINIRMSSLCT